MEHVSILGFVQEEGKTQNDRVAIKRAERSEKFRQNEKRS